MVSTFDNISSVRETRAAAGSWTCGQLIQPLPHCFRSSASRLRTDSVAAFPPNDGTSFLAVDCHQNSGDACITWLRVCIPTTYVVPERTIVLFLASCSNDRRAAVQSHRRNGRHMLQWPYTQRIAEVHGGRSS
jgi:hypothetical protein